MTTQLIPFLIIKTSFSIFKLNSFKTPNAPSSQKTTIKLSGAFLVWTYDYNDRNNCLSSSTIGWDINEAPNSLRKFLRFLL